MAQAASQARDFDADDRVGSRVERLAPAECLGRNGVLLELVGLTGQRPFQKEPQDGAGPSRSLECMAGENPFQLPEHLITRDRLRDKVYFTIDTEDELAAKWPRILALRPDFIKTNLSFSDELEQRRNDPAFAGRKALDPKLLRVIVERAHANGLQVSAHTVNGADFRNAVNAGVDEIVHVPAAGAFPTVEQRMTRIVTNTLDETALQTIAADLAR